MQGNEGKNRREEIGPTRVPHPTTYFEGNEIR